MAQNTKLRDLMLELVREIADKGIYWDEAAAQFEKQFIQHTLAKYDGNVQRSAKEMGIHRNTLARKITLYRIGRK